MVVIADAVAVKVLLTLVPRVVTAPIETTMIKATMTAYSTAVGPSSLLRNLTNFSRKAFMGESPVRKEPKNCETRRKVNFGHCQGGVKNQRVLWWLILTTIDDKIAINLRWL